MTLIFVSAGACVFLIIGLAVLASMRDKKILPDDAKKRVEWQKNAERSIRKQVNAIQVKAILKYTPLACIAAAAAFGVCYLINLDASSSGQVIAAAVLAVGGSACAEIAVKKKRLLAGVEGMPEEYRERYQAAETE